MAKRGRKEKDNWKKKRRQEYLEKKEFRYYIFCEGQATEPKYFQGFKRYIEDNPIYRDMVLIEIEGCQAETMRVIGKAEEYVRKNKITKGQIWCVYDKDSFPASDFNGVVRRAKQTGRCLVQIYKDNTQGIFYDNFQYLHHISDISSFSSYIPHISSNDDSLC